MCPCNPRCCEGISAEDVTIFTTVMEAIEFYAADFISGKFHRT